MDKFFDFHQYPVIAFDTETTGLHWPVDKLFGFSLSTPDGKSVYHDIRHCPKSIDWFNYQMSMFKGRIVCHKAGFDYKMAASAGLYLPLDRMDCSIIRQCLIDEHEMAYSLDHLSMSYLGEGKVKEIYGDLAALFGGKATRSMQMKNLHRAPPELVAPYAETDTSLTLRLWQWQEGEIERQGLHDITAFERRVMVPIIKAEMRGIRVDAKVAERSVDELTVVIDEMQMRINDMVGFEINVNSPKQVRTVFNPKKDEYDIWRTDSGYSLKETDSGNPSIDADALREMETDPRAKLILDIRSTIKTRDTFIAGHVLGHMVGDRVYPNINQTKGEDAGTSCMTGDTLIQTNKGWVRVTDVSIGDFVLDHEGCEQTVIDKIYNGSHPIYKITTKSGHTIKVTGNHPFLSDGAWVRADCLNVGDDLSVYGEPEKFSKIRDWPYEVSSWGRIRHVSGNICMLQTKSPGNGHPGWGHLKITLSKGDSKRKSGNRKDFAVHRLVAEYFDVGGCGGVVMHDNGISWDNNVQNLLYGTQKENVSAGVNHGSYDDLTGKLDWDKVCAIRSIEGRTQKSIADEYGVSRELIREIIHGRRWKDRGTNKKKAKYSKDVICDIEVLEDEKTYGLEVSNTHTHLTNGIVTHNTGRLSYTDPALQQIPSRNLKVAAIVKPIFLPEEGHRWTSLDMHSFEVRVFAHLVNNPAIIQRYKDIPLSDFHAMVAEMSGLPRDATYSGQANAKQMNLSLIFNSGNGAIADKMGMPWEWSSFETGKTLMNKEGKLVPEVITFKKAGPEAMKVIKDYHRALPGVKELANNAKNIAEKFGYVQTKTGRHLRFPRKHKTYKASGLCIQATSADINKEMWLQTCELDYGHLILNTHDSYEISHEESKKPDDIRQELQDKIQKAVPWMRVPLMLDLSGSGKDWWDAIADKKLKKKK